MALRVLLADESSTIRKVMQLALQDFGVEVKSVPIGLDVLQVARSFHPDIVFADVLLSKRNGYEVSSEIKDDPTLKKIPVVLMWSGFMELDETKAKSSRAEKRLEKPFDAETLRSIVKELVPSLGSNAISNFLSFPEMPEMVEDEKPLQEMSIPTLESMPEEEEPVEIQLKGPMPKPAAKTGLNQTKTQIPAAQDPFPALDEIEEIEEPEEFQSVPLPKNQGLPPPPKAKPTAPPEDWARQDLSKYKIDLPQDDEFPMDEADLTNTSIALSSGIEEIALEDLDSPEPKPLGKTRPATPHNTTSKTFSLPPEEKLSPMTMSSLDPMRAEEILRQEARSVLESVAWKLLPEIVERVVREELQKLLKDAERL